MCLLALSLRQHPRFPLVLAANRDEFFRRPAVPLDWWTPHRGKPAVLSGRDLEAGGTWLGLNAKGRIAMLTNVRAPGTNRADAPSRGGIVTRWLEGDESADAFMERNAAEGFNGFNVIAGDASRNEWFWSSNLPTARTALKPGLYGLSNAALDTAWPKVSTLKARMAAAIDTTLTKSAETRAGDGDGNHDVEHLAAALFHALADRAIASDATLPGTGVPLEWERMLSPAFIESADRAYGTRCSTVIVSERTPAGLVTHVFEQTHPGSSSLPASAPFDETGVAVAIADHDVARAWTTPARALGSLPNLCRFTLPGWPPA